MPGLLVRVILVRFMVEASMVSEKERFRTPEFMLRSKRYRIGLMVSRVYTLTCCAMETGIGVTLLAVVSLITSSVMDMKVLLAMVASPPVALIPFKSTVDSVICTMFGTGRTFDVMPFRV